MSKTSKLRLFWSSISSGVFLIGYNVGTGSITAMASAGSEYGMSLSWALLLSCIFTFCMLMAFSTFTMQTSQGSMQAIRSNFGSPVTVFIIFALLFAELMSALGLMGVSAQVVQEWSRSFTSDGQGWNPIAVAVVFAIVLGLVCWKGEQHFFENLLAVFVALMGVAFIMTMFVVMPSPAEFLSSLKPAMPAGSGSFVVVSSMVGTTMGAIVFVARSVMVRDKGWSMKDMKIQRRDAIISVSMMFILSFAVMACASSALRGEHIDNAIQMVALLEPLVGNFATTFFAVGIVAAALSSLFPILLLAPWLISDYEGKPCNMRSTRTRILMYGVLACSLLTPILGWRPVKVVLISQTLCNVATPLVVLFMTLLLNNPKVMTQNRPKLWQNMIYVIVFLFSLATAFLGVRGLFDFI